MTRLVHLNHTVLPMGDVFAIRGPKPVAALFIYFRICAYIAVNLCIYCTNKDFCSVCAHVDILQPSIITFMSKLYSYLEREHKSKTYNGLNKLLKLRPDPT